MDLTNLNLSQSLSSRAMSFDNQTMQRMAEFASLNPFRTGRCLSTQMKSTSLRNKIMSQSLSNRAMSFDL